MIPTCDHYIAKTLAHLAGGMAFTALGAKMTITEDFARALNLKDVSAALLGFIFLAVALALPLALMAMSATNPLKYVVAAIWTFILGLGLRPLVQALDDKDVLFRTLVLTTGVFVGAFVVALYDNQNMLGFGPYLFAALIGLIITQIGLAIAGAIGPRGMRSIENILSFIGAGLFALFTAYDTQVMKQNARSCRGVPDYINQAFSFFTDFLNLFTNVANLSR